MGNGSRGTLTQADPSTIKKEAAEVDGVRAEIQSNSENGERLFNQAIQILWQVPSEKCGLHSESKIQG